MLFALRLQWIKGALLAAGGAMMALGAALYDCAAGTAERIPVLMCGPTSSGPAESVVHAAGHCPGCYLMVAGFVLMLTSLVSMGWRKARLLR